VKPSKPWLIVNYKVEHLDLAIADCGIGITAEGKSHLSAAIGSQAFVEQYISDKADYLVSCVRKLSEIAKAQPHVAYRAFTHGLVGRWTYFLCTLPNISDFFFGLLSLQSSRISFLL